jgi:hypothetical protein
LASSAALLAFTFRLSVMLFSTPFPDRIFLKNYYKIFLYPYQSMPSFNRIVYTTNVYLQNLKQPGFPVQVTEKTGNLPIFDLSNFVIKKE